MDDRLAALRADRNRLCEELSITRRVIHAASRKAQRIRRATSHAWCLLPLMLDTMLTIYVLAGYTPEPAVVYLQQCGRRRRWVQRPEDALARMVEDHFLQCDDERLASLTDVREPLDDSILGVAVRYVQEWQLVKWGIALNVEKGVAPPTSMLLSQACVIGIQPPSAFAALGARWRMSVRASGWAARFRKRWNVRLGKLRAREWISTEDARAKAIETVSIFLASALGLRRSAISCMLPDFPTPLFIGCASMFSLPQASEISCHVLICGTVFGAAHRPPG